MSDTGPAACADQFAKLLARSADVDLFRVGLEIGRDVDPAVDSEACLAWVEARADEIRGEVARASDERSAASMIAACLSERHGLTGDATAYDSASGSLPHGVIETGCGLPLGLAVVYRAVGERVGLDLATVAAPSHFLLGLDGAEGPLFVDCYSGGRVLTRRECLAWLPKVSGLPAAVVAGHLRPADPRTVVRRMLLNVRTVLLKTEQFRKAWSIQHRLLSLNPTGFPERRDLAVIATRSGRPGEAIDLIKGCLDVAPAAERSCLEKLLAEARADLCRWN